MWENSMEIAFLEYSALQKVHSEDTDLSITYLKKANEIAQEGTLR